MIIVRNAAPVRQVLSNVYRALELDMDPSTVGSLNEFDSNISVDDLITSLTTTLKNHFEITEVDLAMNFQNTEKDLVNA